MKNRAWPMHLERKRFRIVFAVLLLANALASAVSMLSRKPLDADGWEFLERQRPRITETATGFETSFSMVHDGLDFALFRRPIGGWESLSVRVYALLNLPAHLVARIAFEFLQTTTTCDSKLHADIATAIFCAVAVAQCAVIAALVSLTPRHRSQPALRRRSRG